MIDQHDDRAVPVAAAATLLAAMLAATLFGAVLAACSPQTWLDATRPHASAGALIAVLALGAGWLLLLRLLAAAIAAVVGLLPGALGHAGRALAHRLTPALLRRLVRGVVGLTIAAGPLATGGASWAGGPAAGLPDLDRVASVPAVGAPASQPVNVPALLPAAAEVVVRPGDSLWRIAAANLPPEHTDAQVARAWPRWYAANRAVIGADPGALRPGQRLAVPTSGSTASS